MDKKNSQRYAPFLEKKKNELFPIELMVDVSFNGHKAGDNSLFKLDIRADFDSRNTPASLGSRPALHSNLKIIYCKKM